MINLEFEKDRYITNIINTKGDGSLMGERIRPAWRTAIHTLSLEETHAPDATTNRLMMINTN